MQVCVGNATCDSGIAMNSGKMVCGIGILVLGEFRSTSFVFVQQVPLVLFGHIVPSFGCPRYARARRRNGSSGLE